MEKKSSNVVTLFILISTVFLLNGCATLRTYDDLNTKTKEEIRYMMGPPSNIYKVSVSQLRYGADELWVYRGDKYSCTIRFYFENDKVVEAIYLDNLAIAYWGDRMNRKIRESKNKTKEEIINMMGMPDSVCNEPSEFRDKGGYGADEMWLYQPDYADTYIYFKDNKVVKKEMRWWEAL